MMTAARQARLNSESGGGAWCPRQMIDLDHKLEEWLEVDRVYRKTFFLFVFPVVP